MTQTQIKELFSDNQTIGDFLSIPNVVDVAKDVNVEFKMDDEGMNYYYLINISELANSNVDDDTIYKMINQGWVLHHDGKSIVKYC